MSVAFNRMGDWISNSFTMVMERTGPIAIVGAAIFGLYIGVGAVSQAVGMIGNLLGPAGTVFSTVVNQLLQVLVNAVIAVIAIRTMLILMYERTPDVNEVLRFDDRFLNGFLAALLAAFVSWVAGLLCSSPGMVMMGVNLPWEFLQWIQDSNTPGRTPAPPPFESISGLFWLGLSVAVIPMMIIMLVVQVLTYFAVPLAVERGLGPVEAVKESFRKAGSDFAGLLLFFFVAGILFMAAGIIAMCFTCCIGYVLVYPFWYVLQMQAYADYFGLGLDPNPPAPAPYWNYPPGGELPPPT